MIARLLAKCPSLRVASARLLCLLFLCLGTVSGTLAESGTSNREYESSESKQCDEKTDATPLRVRQHASRRASALRRIRSHKSVLGSEPSKNGQASHPCLLVPRRCRAEVSSRNGFGGPLLA